MIPPAALMCSQALFEAKAVSDLLGQLDAGLRVTLNVANVEIADVDSDVVFAGDVGQQAGTGRGGDLVLARAHGGERLPHRAGHDVARVAAPRRQGQRHRRQRRHR